MCRWGHPVTGGQLRRSVRDELGISETNISPICPVNDTPQHRPLSPPPHCHREKSSFLTLFFSANQWIIRSPLRNIKIENSATEFSPWLRHWTPQISRELSLCLFLQNINSWLTTLKQVTIFNIKCCITWILTSSSIKNHEWVSARRMLMRLESVLLIILMTLDRRRENLSSNNK